MSTKNTQKEKNKIKSKNSHNKLNDKKNARSDNRANVKPKVSSAPRHEKSTAPHLLDRVPANTVEGRNAVIELLKSGRDADKIYVAKEAGGIISKITALARAHGVPISYCDKRKLDSMSITGAHQGVIALASAVNYATLEQALALAASHNQKPLLLICDGITDPGNLGAIIRSAEIFGAHGVIISKHGGAGLNAACAKAAAGALEYVPVIRANGIAACIDRLKKMGLWIIGMDGGGSTDISEVGFSDPCAIVIGSEGSGISRLALESCDFVAKIPMRGKISSLNASVAAAIALYEASRARA